MIRITGIISLSLAFIAGIQNTHAQNVSQKQAAKPAVSIENKRALENVSEDRFRGKWQEIKRRRLDNGEYLAFKDTLLVDVQESETIIRETGSGGQTRHGQLEISGNDVKMAGTTYAVGKISAEEWTLYDETWERTLKAVQRFATEKTGLIKVTDYATAEADRKSTRLNSSHEWISRMPSSA